VVLLELVEDSVDEDDDEALQVDTVGWYFLKSCQPFLRGSWQTIE
jgi:hypothetical protein